MDQTQLDTTINNATQCLLAQRTAAGHWEGELSSSALSTATAVLTLHLFDRMGDVIGGRRLGDLIQSGADWLATHQNGDGGWGDTTLSLSNVSTTALCWGALKALRSNSLWLESIAAAEGWLRRTAGGLDPQQLSHAILNRYGKDRTFSVPILTHLALAGCLGTDRQSWRLIPQLPFELAACPASWFRHVRLPVVSYALPALIAIGIVRHTMSPAGNPLWRSMRNGLRGRTLRVLRNIQPASGGFLEATPLTSFVCMSLIGAGEQRHPVVAQGIKFLAQSVRPDGSWPIDSNLATWVTTLSINALGPAMIDSALDTQERLSCTAWLLKQQYRRRHPYTQADPGGWGWTDLPGGVPDADDTPGALLALAALSADDDEVRQAAEAGIEWLLGLQNRDGGFPTFCRGWGLLPFDRSSADLTAHAVRAFLAWQPRIAPKLRARVSRSIQRAVRYLLKNQSRSGAWAPLWFGNQHAPDEVNLTYGTSRVLRMLTALSDEYRTTAVEQAARLGAQWLCASRNADGGWGGAPGTPSSIEETAQAIEALAGLPAKDVHPRLIEDGACWLIDHTRQGTSFPPTPIGFYFAKLWYFERLYPIVFTLAALNRVKQYCSVHRLQPQADCNGVFDRNTSLDPPISTLRSIAPHP
jgi:squalene-hopene/tetraprenyl-beta-curcumene cyclase